MPPGYSLSETIEKPPGEVFAWLVDPSRRYQWVPGLVTVETRGDTRWREERRVGLRAGHGEVIVTLCEGPDDGRAPPYRVSLARPAGRGRIEQRFELHAEGDKATRATLKADVSGGLLGPLSSTWLARRLAREDADLLLRLKSAVETEGLWP